MQIQLAVLCDAATDYGGKLNLLGTFDTLITTHLPAVHPQCAIALRLTFNKSEEGGHNLKINFMDEDGRPVLNPPLDMRIEAAVPDDTIFVSRNAIIILQNLKLDRAGLYSLEITVDGAPATNIPLLVKYMPHGTPH
jgi:hypothetical protein